jgi:hypothetical protein
VWFGFHPYNPANMADELQKQLPKLCRRNFLAPQHEP